MSRTPPSRRALLAAAGLAATGMACQAPRSRALVESDDELDELFSDLTDRSGEWEPITRAEKRARVERLGRILTEQSLGALLIEPGPTLTYLCDVQWGLSERLFALVVRADGTCFWVAPAFEAPLVEKRIAAAEGPAGPIVAWDEHVYAWEPLAAALREREIGRIAIEPRARAFVAQHLAWSFGPERVVPAWDVVRALRGTKDAHELALMRGACELTQAAIAAVAERMRPGIEDRELGAWMRHAQKRLGLANPWVLSLFGESAAFPHGEAKGRLLEPGTLVLVDTGGALHGYQSDITRTWCFEGPGDAEHQRAWLAVRDAQQRAFERLRPGIPCLEIDRAARVTLEQAGYGRGYTSFAHRLGHGIGLEVHEEPYLDGGSSVQLAAGMTFSDEPGLYLPGRFGVRLEDIVVVTEQGGDHFGDWQESLRSPVGPA